MKPARRSDGSAHNLALNVGWSAIFFGMRSPGLAFAEIVILWLAIAATAIVFLGQIDNRGCPAHPLPCLDIIRGSAEFRHLENELVQ